MDLLQEGHQLRPARIEASALRRGLDRKAHLDVGRAELAAGEPFALRQLGLHVVEVAFQVGLDHRLLDLGRNAARDRLGEERHRRGLDPVEHQLHQQRRHRRAFGEVQPVGEAQPLGRSRRRLEPTRAVALEQVFDDRARLGDRDVAVGDDRRLAERMHLEQRRWRQHRLRVALVLLDLVRDDQLLQQPEHALRAGVVEVVDDDHEEPGEGA